MKKNADVLKKFFSEIKKDKKQLLIIIVAAIGIILIVISNFENFDAETEETSAAESNVFSEAEYTKNLENKLEDMIASLNGAGRTKVSIMLECDYETVYARDGSYSQKDGASDEENEYIIIDSDKQEGGLVLKTVTPKVRGVAVLCEGGDLPQVEIAVCEMLEALLDVGANHISVSKIQ